MKASGGEERKCLKFSVRSAEANVSSAREMGRFGTSGLLCGLQSAWIRPHRPQRIQGRRRRMSEIQYQSAKTVKEAVKMMQAAKGKGYILAGGTDLLVQMKSGARTPGVIVDVKKIPEMVSISEKNGAFTIGAATPAAVLGEHKKLRKAWPGVIEACNLIGSTQVQGRASRGRQPVQRLAGRRQRAGPGRGGLHRQRGRPQGQARRAGREVLHRPGQDLAEAGRDRRQPDPAGAAEGLVGRLPAPDPAHRDGHRRRRRRRHRSP